jgi:RNA polymerase sigma-70 factor (ECF subfamily)
VSAGKRLSRSDAHDFPETPAGRAYDADPVVRARRGATDRQLIAAVVACHEEALTEIFRRHHRSVEHVARAVLGSWPGAEDVMAEIFLALWLKPEQFDPQRGSLLGFLRMRARARSVELIRSEAARNRREERSADPSGPLTNDVDFDLLSVEAARRVHGALNLLPEKEREAIELAFFGRMPYHLVALNLSVPEGTVKSRIRSGLVRLRVIFEA